jgi:hypothetical protein
MMRAMSVKWWKERGVQAIEHAERLWHRTQGNSGNFDSRRSNAEEDRVGDPALESAEEVAVQQAD